MQSGVITTNLDGHLYPDRDSHVHLASQLVSPLLEIIEESQEHLLTRLLLHRLHVPEPWHGSPLVPLPVLGQDVGHLSAGVHHARVKPFLEVLQKNITSYMFDFIESSGTS